MMRTEIFDGIEWVEAAHALMNSPFDMGALRQFESEGKLDRKVTKCGGYVFYRKDDVCKLVSASCVEIGISFCPLDRGK